MWTYRPVLEAWVDIGELEDFPSNTLPGFNERLTAWLPSLIEHRCSEGERGGFLTRLKEGTWTGHILEHVTLELQNLAGMSGGFGRARSTPQRGLYKVVVRAWHPDITRAALHAGRDLILAAIEDRPFDVEGAVGKLRDMANDLLLGPSTACIVDAAEAKDKRIPSIRLSQGNLVQLGYGAAQRRIWTAETERTGAIAESISRDKDLTKQLLQACGIPVPEGTVVRSAEEAWEAAQDIGLPVVVKPTDANHGRGVSLELESRQEVEAAYAIAEREGSEVLVERFIRGQDHRLLIVGGKLAAAARGENLWVVGDGQASVAGLIEAQLNSDPRRGEAETFPLDTIVLERDLTIGLLLGQQGLSAEAVPAAGQRVLIQRNGNMVNDVTEQVHPEVAASAALAARVVGLDIAGIDVVAEDIGRPLAEQGGAIVEVNAGPGLLMHLKPLTGQVQPVGRAIVDHLFPPGQSGRIPVVGVSGSRGKTMVARLVAWLLRLDGKHVGLASSDGLFLDRRQVEAGNRADWAAGQRLLMNRSVEAAVIENGFEAIVSQGLAYDRCQVGVITNVMPELHTGSYHIDSAEKVFAVLRTQVDVILPGGAAVLNACDPVSEQLAGLCDGEVILYAAEPGAPALSSHLQHGGRAVLLRGGDLVLARGAEESRLLAFAQIPCPSGYQSGHWAENVLAALAAAWALEVPLARMRVGLDIFATELVQARPFE